MVAHEHFNHRVAGLAIQRHRLAAMRDRIDQRLTGGVQQRIGLGARPRVAHGDHLNRLAVLVLHLGGDLLQSGSHRTIRCGTFLIQPFAQLALLATRQGEYGGRFLGVQLNQRQRLQHAIMQMGGHVRALLFALLQCLLVGESLQHRVRPRHHRHHDTDDHHESAGNNASRRGAPPRNADIMHIQCPSHENQCDAAQHRQQLRASRTKIHPCQCDAAQPYQQRKHNLDIRTGAGEQQSSGHQRETGQCHDGRFRSTLDGLGQ